LFDDGEENEFFKPHYNNIFFWSIMMLLEFTMVVNQGVDWNWEKSTMWWRKNHAQLILRKPCLWWLTISLSLQDEMFFIPPNCWFSKWVRLLFFTTRCLRHHGVVYFLKMYWWYSNACLCCCSWCIGWVLSHGREHN
jgi:hypothetical protein